MENQNSNTAVATPAVETSKPVKPSFDINSYNPTLAEAIDFLDAKKQGRSRGRPTNETHLKIQKCKGIVKADKAAKRAASKAATAARRALKLQEKAQAKAKAAQEKADALAKAAQTPVAQPTVQPTVTETPVTQPESSLPAPSTEIPASTGDVVSEAVQKIETGEPVAVSTETPQANW